MSPIDDRFFTNPSSPLQRLYEALRARFVDKLKIADAARKFGYSPGTLSVKCTEFRQGKLPPFFIANKPGPKKQPKKDKARLRVFELRKKNCSVYDIERILKEEKRPLCVRAIWEVLKEAGFSRLPRRLDEERPDLPRPEAAAIADRGNFNLQPRRFKTQVGGLFLFLPLLAKLRLESLADTASLPGSKMIPATQYLLSLLALKLFGNRRISHVMDLAHDPGIALFAGLNAIPKTTALTTYSYRIHRPQIEALLQSVVKTAKEAGLLPGGSFNLDFHAIPHFGEESVLERHYVPRRGHAEKGIVTFLAQGEDTRVLCYSNARIIRKNQADEVLKFAEFWKKTTGQYPEELVFDSKLTTIANLSRLDDKGIRFLTLRMKKKSIIRELLKFPASDWKSCKLDVPQRKYRFPKILDQSIHIKGYGKELRQIAATNLGRELPTLLITNNFDEKPAHLLTRYAQRAMIENAIADGIHFFHLDALCSGVQIEVDFSVAITVLANVIYRWFVKDIPGFENATPGKIFRKFIDTAASVFVDKDGVEVILPRRSHNPLLLEAGFGKVETAIPWWDGQTVKFIFK